MGPWTQGDGSNPHGEPDDTQTYWDPTDDHDRSSCDPCATICPMARLAHELAHARSHGTGSNHDLHWRDPMFDNEEWDAIGIENLARACCGDPPRTQLNCGGG